MPNNPLMKGNLNTDQNIWWRPGRVYIPSRHMTGMIGTAGVDAGTHTGAPVDQEISTLGINALLMDTAGDEINHLMMLPADLDPQKNIYFRVHWTSGSSTTADTIDWLVRYLAITPNTTTLVNAATATSTNPAQDTVIGAYTHQATEWGAIYGGVIGSAVEFIEWEIELDAFAAGLTEDKHLLGLEIAYSPRRMYYGDGMSKEAKMPTYMLSKNYPN